MAEVSNLKKPSRKGEPPKASATSGNLIKPAIAEKVPLQVKIPPEIRADFKSYAAAHTLEGSQLFLMIWDYYKEHHG